MARRGPGARDSEPNQTDFWWTAPEGSAHERLLPYVEQVERSLSHHFNRFERLAFLYDPYGASRDTSAGGFGMGGDSLMQENVIASNCDAITGSIAATEIRPRLLTDGEPWSVQRDAQKMTWYAEGLAKQLDLSLHATEAFHAGSLKGTGLIKVFVDPFDEIRAEVVPVDDIVVDEVACMGRPPRNMQQRRLVGRDVLCAAFPEHEDKILSAQQSRSSNRAWKKWAGYRPIKTDELVVAEGWRLPMGRKGHKNYVPGKHAICIDGVDLVYDDYHKSYFPFAVFKWTKRPDAWYGISGAERIIGQQRRLNKRNWHIDKQLDQIAVPVRFVRPVDANLAVKGVNRAGMTVVVRGDYPQTQIPQAVGPEVFADRENTKSSAFEEFGQSRMQASAMKPAGIESGAALREYKDQTTSRFSTQEKGFERLLLDAVLLALDCAHDLGEKAPKISKASRFGKREVTLKNFDMETARRQLVAASALGKTPAGRTQLAMEIAQLGLISMDGALRLIAPNSSLDVTEEMSFWVAAAEDIDACIEEMEEGEVIVPEPTQHLELGIGRVQKALLRDRRQGAPEEVLEVMRQWIVLADAELAMKEAPAPQMPAAMPMDPMAAAPAVPGAPPPPAPGAPVPQPISPPQLAVV